MNDTAPQVALIIPSLGGHVDALLASVRHQTLQPAEIEVVRGVRPNGRARNQGVARTSAPILVFVDDDAVLGDEHVIANLVAPLLADPTVGVAGAAKLLPPDAPAFQRWVAREVPRVEHAVVDTPLETNPDPPSFYCEITTTCCAMRRAVFEQAGGFDEALVRGVDTEFFVRLRRMGGRDCEMGVRENHPQPHLPTITIALSWCRTPGLTTPRRPRCARCCASTGGTAWATPKRCAAMPPARVGARCALRCTRSRFCYSAPQYCYQTSFYPTRSPHRRGGRA